MFINIKTMHTRCNIYLKSLHKNYLKTIHALKNININTEMIVIMHRNYTCNWNRRGFIKSTWLALNIPTFQKHMLERVGDVKSQNIAVIKIRKVFCFVIVLLSLLFSEILHVS